MDSEPFTPNFPFSGIGFGEDNRKQAEELFTGVEAGDEMVRFFADPDLRSAFSSAVMDPVERGRYAEETSAFLSGKEGEADPKYVLFYRRTLPSDPGEPKPEAHWTSDYITARNGLRLEIPHLHRLHTVILCASLAELLKDGGYDEANSAQSDGEIKIISPGFDQSRCICIIKPQKEQQELSAHLDSNKDALDLAAIRALLKEKAEAKQVNRSQNAPSISIPSGSEIGEDVW
jgi:hypothetical protein